MPAYVTARARQLNLRRNVYLAVLLSNYLNGPAIPLPHVEPPDKKLKRAIVTVTMPTALRREGQRAAARWKISFSALIESLIIHDAQRDQDADTLTIHPVRGKPSPRLRGR